MALNPSLQPEIGPDGLPREAPVIAYTEKIIEEEQRQVRKYIEENYSKIRDVERELGNLTMDLKLTAGPKKAALEHLRKKIEFSTEKIRVAKMNEEEARKAFEAASKAVKDEEATKQKLCEDLNNLVQQSSNTQFARLEELKRRLEAMNLSRASTYTVQDLKQSEPGQSNTDTPPLLKSTTPISTVNGGSAVEQADSGNAIAMNGYSQQASLEGEKKRNQAPGKGRGRGIGAVPKGRGSSAPGWTGAGFDS